MLISSYWCLLISSYWCFISSYCGVLRYFSLVGGSIPGASNKVINQEILVEFTVRGFPSVSDQRIAYLGEYCGIDTIRSSGLPSFFRSLNKRNQERTGRPLPGSKLLLIKLLKNEEGPEDLIVSIAQYSPRYEILWSDTEGNPLTVNSTRIWIRPYLSHLSSVREIFDGILSLSNPGFLPPRQ